jgi:thiosulfate/3-mercaptopyruvate sulfurtransferase
MAYQTLISAQQLYQHYDPQGWVIIDCRYYPTHADKGRQHYLSGHLPNAHYAHLDKDLSGPAIVGQTGNHPLPDAALLRKRLTQWGIQAGKQVVVYDDWGGNIASRLWWLLNQWLNHQDVALLDGGLAAWQQAGYPLSQQPPQIANQPFTNQVNSEAYIAEPQALAVWQSTNNPWIDTRLSKDYRGSADNPATGHIPQAINKPFLNNLNSQGYLLSQSVLQQQFQEVLSRSQPDQSVFYCGSGITATQGILALKHCSGHTAKLYVGSWSHWSQQATWPKEQGV